jgi:hypothetical protein
MNVTVPQAEGLTKPFSQDFLDQLKNNWYFFVFNQNYHLPFEALFS